MEVGDEYGDSNAGSEEDEVEALSFCDLPNAAVSEEYESTLRDSNARSSDNEDFVFALGRSSWAAQNCSCPADDLFHRGRLLPLQSCPNESSAQFSYKSKWGGENRRLLNEKLQAWRTESLESQSSYWTRSTSSNSQGSLHRKNFSGSEKSFRPGNLAGESMSKSDSEKSFRSGNLASMSKSRGNLISESMSKSKSKSANQTSCPSSSVKCQFFTLGLMKTPPMKIEELRLRKGKAITSNGGAEKSPKHTTKKEIPAPVNSKLRCRGLKILAPLTSLNACKASTDSVVNCFTSKKRVAEPKSMATL